MKRTACTLDQEKVDILGEIKTGVLLHCSLSYNSADVCHQWRWQKPLGHVLVMYNCCKFQYFSRLYKLCLSFSLVNFCIFILVEPFWKWFWAMICFQTMYYPGVTKVHEHFDVATHNMGPIFLLYCSLVFRVLESHYSISWVQNR